MNANMYKKKAIHNGFELRSNNKGAAYVLALTSLVVGVTLAVAMVSSAGSYFLGESSRERNGRAANLAEAGVHYAYWQVVRNGVFLPYNANVTMATGSFEVNAVDNGANTMLITSTGTSRGSQSTMRRITKSLFELIVDNSSPNFNCSKFWAIASASKDKYGNDYRWHSTGILVEYATWNIYVPKPGSYDVYACWPRGGNRSTVSPYTIKHSGGTTTVKVNQQLNGGKWNFLGRWNFAAGNTTIQLSYLAPSGFVVVADAVRLVGPY